ncbi:hypothetical protein WMF28_15690 [Sorangium sp. So ce590]|uniref:hypothetical protein n=1 Tax=Sorangium sp. So ce590 TaxID=3133317 RepID=UPI003F5DA995
MASRTDDEALLVELSQALGLEYEPQDWGIINADAGRLEEFIAYYDEHPMLSSTQRFALGELVLASANEVLMKTPEAELVSLSTFLAQHAEDFMAEVEYWETLGDVEEFPLSAWLQENLPKKVE